MADQPKRSRRSDADPDARAKAQTPVRIHLLHARYRHLGSAVFGLVGGGLLLWKLGVIGQVLGLGLLGVATVAAISFVRTLLHPAGTIEVAEADITLPTGICRRNPRTIPRAEVRHAFLLRRAVSWTRAGPVLVIETADTAFTYPRDWFGSESDQQRVVRAIGRSSE